MWLDLTNDKCPLPTVDGQVIVKATRISWKQGNDVVRQSSVDEPRLIRKETKRRIAESEASSGSIFGRNGEQIRQDGEQLVGSIYNKAKNFMGGVTSGISQSAAVSQPKQQNFDDLFK